MSFIYLRDQKSFFRVVLVLYTFRWDLFYISYIFIYSVFLMTFFFHPSRLKPLFCKYVFRYVIKIPLRFFKRQLLRMHSSHFCLLNFYLRYSFLITAKVSRLYPILTDCQNNFSDWTVWVQVEECIQWATVAVARGVTLLGPNSGNVLQVVEVLPQTGTALKQWDRSKARELLWALFQAVGSWPVCQHLRDSCSVALSPL